MKYEQRKELTIERLEALLDRHGFRGLQPSDQWGNSNYLAYRKTQWISLNVTIKPCLWIEESLLDVDVNVAFLNADTIHLYHHDDLVDALRRNDPEGVLESSSWVEEGRHRWPVLPQWAEDLTCAEEYLAREFG